MNPETPASFSEPPLPLVSGPTIASKPARSATFVDVAMRLVNDGPMYAVIALVGILALKGQASASEMVITALGALLARSWPRAVQIGGAAAVVLALSARALSSASPPSPSLDAVAANVASSARPILLERKAP